MKIKKMGRFLLFMTMGSAAGITLAPFGIYVKEKYLSSKYVLNHESIHWKQQMEMFVVFFYLWYGLEFLCRLIKNGRDAYMNISLEKEAYENERDLEYIKHRKPYAWLKMLK